MLSPVGVASNAFFFCEVCQSKAEITEDGYNLICKCTDENIRKFSIRCECRTIKEDETGEV